MNGIVAAMLLLPRPRFCVKPQTVHLSTSADTHPDVSSQAAFMFRRGGLLAYNATRMQLPRALPPAFVCASCLTAFARCAVMATRFSSLGA